ncbi:hypothetical protein C4571_01945 [Candidatus Parcubacteria bacterium]|nr:MAG: hypothetical protein C4571_01945 [Candidatus Parcubacteria bacterium]
MAFEPIDRDADLTFFKSGQVYITQSAAERYFKGISLVRVEYDPEALSVSFSPATTDGPAMRQVWNTTRGTMTISIRMLFRRFHFHLRKTVYANFYRKDDRIVFNLPADAIIRDEDSAR